VSLLADVVEDLPQPSPSELARAPRSQEVAHDAVLEDRVVYGADFRIISAYSRIDAAARR
jgi:hypothetical protein